MIPNALIYETRLMNAQSREAALVKATRRPLVAQVEVLADRAGRRTPCLYNTEATQ